MRWLLSLLLVIVMAGDVRAAGEGAFWPQDRLPVRSYMPEAWQPYVADAVVAFNRRMPRSVPRLVYHAKPQRRCEGIPARRSVHAIVICPNDRGHLTLYDQDRGRIVTSAVVRIWREEMAIYRANTICHELMHALTGIPDRSWQESYGAESCVWGDVLAVPGPADIAFAQQVYRRH